jgi:plastocyanin
LHRKLIAVAVVGATAVVGAVVPAPADAAKLVRVGDNYFSPGSVTVRKGTVLAFSFRGRLRHNVVGSAFKNISLRKSGTVRRKTRKKGAFTLRCTVHPGMSMRLRVR